MPEYTAKIFNNNAATWLRPDLMRKWYEKHDGRWFKAKFEIIGESEDPKTAGQLGYYWGLLLPEIHKQLQQDGHTVTISFRGIKREIPITKAATHEIITALCGRVGQDGEGRRLSEIGLVKNITVIGNILNFAGELGMNVDELKAHYPHAEKVE